MKWSKYCRLPRRQKKAIDRKLKRKHIKRQGRTLGALHSRAQRLYPLVNSSGFTRAQLKELLGDEY